MQVTLTLIVKWKSVLQRLFNKVMITFLDLPKAFDSMDRKKLKAKLEKVGLKKQSAVQSLTKSTQNSIYK